MRTRIVTTVVAFGLGALLVWPAMPASGKSISTPDLKTLTNTIDHAKKVTYYAQYTSVSNGQKATVTIAQAPPKSIFSSSDSSIINTGKTSYYCSASSGSTSNSGNTGTTSTAANTGSTGSTGNSGNSGSPSTSTTSTTSNSPEQCLSEKGANPLLGLQDIFSPTVALGALAEAKEGLVSKLLGIKVSSSSAAFAGQPSTCIAVTVHGKGGKYCVTKQGILSYSGSSSSDYFQLTKFSVKPPASLFTLPAGATIGTLPGGGSSP